MNNRIIKFRAWDKKRGRVVDVSIIDFVEKYVIVTDEFKWNEDKETGEAECQIYFKDLELMQFTGLYDKNGKGIYESDLVKYKNRVWEVRYYYGGFNLFEKDTKCADFNSWWEQVEVVGNIYESN